MSRRGQAFLVGVLKVSVSPPVFLGTCIFSNDAGFCFSTSERFLFDITHSYGSDYADAVENLKREVALSQTTSWALEHLREPSDIEEDAKMARRNLREAARAADWHERNKHPRGVGFLACDCGAVIGEWGEAGELWNGSIQLVNKRPSAEEFNTALRKSHRPARRGGCI